MKRYQCTLPEYHGDDDWIEMEAWTAEAAARGFAEYMDSHDSEMFQRPDQDAVDVKVRALGGDKIETFHINFDYVKQWYVRRAETV